MGEADRPQKFKLGNRFNQRDCEETQSGEDVELSLGLSLNGRFGVDPRAKKLCRSSSIPDFLSPTRENGTGFAVPFMSSNSNLVRTSSLPTETDEQWRQRKEMQMLRRMEAKRKRSEKQRNMKAVKDRIKDLGEDSCEACDESKRENGSFSHTINQNSNGSSGAGAEVLLPKTKVTAPSSQGSIGSQESASSGASESESNPVQGMNKCRVKARSPVSVQSLSECERKVIVTPNPTTDGKSLSPLTSTMENSRSVKPTVANGAKETVKNMLEDMPCVSTKGDGPNGRRIEGFLYRYRKGEEVRIVCVCHGSFLSPAEFVKHAGGGDVAHPLKHIVVNPYPVL